MSENPLEKFGAYQKALALFDLVVDDMKHIQSRPECWRLVGQQVASADSVCSNIEEGYGRGSRKEYIHFLVIARGSAQETMGRYGRLKHWLNPQTIGDRALLCSEIIKILTASIKSLRAKP